MKVLLAAINAKYIHSNLGIYSLKTYGEKMLKEWGLAEEAKVSLAEYTINHQMEQILQDIYKRKPDVIGFSCYIWNISYVKMILADIKKVLPDVKIWAGGPEVSYHAEAFLKEEPAVDIVMMGEGEITFAHFLKALLEGEELKQVPGLMLRNDDGTITDTLSPGNGYEPDPVSLCFYGYERAGTPYYLLRKQQRLSIFLRLLPVFH